MPKTANPYIIWVYCLTQSVTHNTKKTFQAYKI
jgi:hypothetical protein